MFFSCSFVLTQKNQKVKENLKALRWSFVAHAYAIHATTITSVIAQEAAPPNFPLPAHINCILHLLTAYFLLQIIIKVILNFMKQVNPVLAAYIVLVFGINKVIELLAFVDTFFYKHEGMLPDNGVINSSVDDQ